MKYDNWYVNTDSVIKKHLLTVNDLFSAQCAKESLFLFNFWWEKIPLLAHPS